MTVHLNLNSPKPFTAEHIASLSFDDKLERALNLTKAARAKVSYLDQCIQELNSSGKAVICKYALHYLGLEAKSVVKSLEKRVQEMGYRLTVKYKDSFGTDYQDYMDWGGYNTHWKKI